MKVSIIIPVFNGEKYIDKCLESCVNQTYKNIEIICINDGSTDKTSDHIKKFINKYKNIILIEQENLGVAVARNVGIKQSTGEYLMFVDADDYIDSKMVEIMFNKLVQSNVDSVKCNIKTTLKFLQHTHIDKEHIYEKEEYEQLISQQLLEDNSIFSSTCNGIYKRDLCPLFPEKICIGEDVIFNFKYFLKSSNVLFIESALYYYRDNQESTTHKKSLDVILNNLEHFNSYPIVKEFLKELNLSYNLDKFLDKSSIINYAIYTRLIFQIFSITKKNEAIHIAKKYYNFHKKNFSKVSKKDITNFLQESYHWSRFKITTCVIPLHKRYFSLSYIGYKYIYKKYKSVFKN